MGTPGKTRTGLLLYRVDFGEQDNCRRQVDQIFGVQPKATSLPISSAHLTAEQDLKVVKTPSSTTCDSVESPPVTEATSQVQRQYSVRQRAPLHHDNYLDL